MRTLALALAAALMIGASGAYAADSKATDATAKTETAKPAKHKTNKPKKERSEKSKKCSADADAKKLHGKARKTFRKECMKAA